MKKSYLLILLSSVCLHLFAFEFSGDPKSWSKENFVGFDIPFPPPKSPDMIVENDIETQDFRTIVDSIMEQISL